MSKELDIPEHSLIMDQIARLWLTGTRNPTSITKELVAKGTKISRADVLKYIDEYKEIARNDEEIKNRAKEALIEADEALHMVIQEFWVIVNNTDDDKVKNAALKNIADVDIKRVETLQKAGLYDDAALGDELAEMERRQQVLYDILKEVSLNCEHCKVEVARRLRKFRGDPEPIPEPKIIEAEVVSSRVE